MFPEFTAKQTHTFQSRIDKSAGPDACWPYKGGRHKAGYGIVLVGTPPTRMLTHRAMYILTHGSIPNDKPRVLHSCDNPPCCNPNHLRAGTDKDNMTDRVIRGRGTKLRGDDIRRIRELWGTKYGICAQLAKEYNVTPELISMVGRRKVWAHFD